MCKKLKTRISGLDILMNWDDDNGAPEWPKDLLIVLRGDRGISKVNLAMEMMIGLSAQFGTERLPRFYSLDKDDDALRKKYEKIQGDSSNIETIFSRPKPEQNSYLYSKLLKFNAIMQEIDKMSCEEKLPCIVIEGFAGLSEEEFNRIPMATLEETLRKKAYTAILVFDNRLTNFGTSAEIIIEMRRSFNEQHNYTHYELQIAKNFLRTATHGWHNYRCDSDGHIVVYPSIHKLLSTTQSVRDRFAEVLDKPQNYNYLDHDVQTKEEVQLQDLLSPKAGTITSIIGANNTFKRRLAALSVIDALKKDNRVLVTLFNERRAGFMDLLRSIDRNFQGNRNLHLLEMPMGCLSHDEFIDMVQRYIERYRQGENSKIHLYMIDLMAFDYVFPMLQAETLFLPALTTICKENEVSLTMVCNKKFSLVDEVCFVSDTVLITQRENTEKYTKEECSAKKCIGNDKEEETIAQNNQKEEVQKRKKDIDADKLAIYLEKNPFGHEQNSRVFKWVINDITACTENIMSLLYDYEICSTKDYWRQTWNVHQR